MPAFPLLLSRSLTHFSRLESPLRVVFSNETPSDLSNLVDEETESKVKSEEEKSFGDNFKVCPGFKEFPASVFISSFRNEAEF